MDKLVLLNPLPTAQSVKFEAVGLSNAKVTVKFTLPSDPYFPGPPPNGDDLTQTVVSGGNFVLDDPQLKVAHVGNSTQFELSGVFASKRPHTGDGVLRLLEALLAMIPAGDARAQLESVISTSSLRNV